MFDKYSLRRGCRLVRLSVLAHAGFAFASVMLAAMPLRAASYTWTASSGDWSVASNWGGTLPGGGDWAYVVNGGTVNVSQLGGSCGTLALGTSAGGGNLQISVGAFSALDQHVGEYGNGIITQSGGQNTWTDGNGALYVGVYAGSSGTYNLNGGQLSGFTLIVGDYGAGTFIQTGGTTSVDGIALGWYNGGTYKLSGSGLLSANEETLGSLSSIGTGTFTQSGGTNSMGSGLQIGETLSYGTYNLSGGQLSAPEESVGGVDGGRGAINQSGGTNTVGSLTMGIYGYSCSYTLTGGLLVVSQMELYGPAETFTLSGGTIQAGGDFSNTAPLTLGAGGGAIFDTAGFTVTPGMLIGSGSLTKAGSGSLILDAANTFSGKTMIGGGTLVLENTLALQNSTLDSSGSGALSFGTLSAATLGGLQGSGSLLLSNTAAAAVSLAVGENNASTTFSGSMIGVGNLIKIGSGVLALAGSNGFTGTTTVSSGTLNLGHALALQNSTVNIGNGALAFAAGFTSPTVGGLTGGGNLTLVTSALEPVNLSVGGNGQSTTYGGNLSGSGGIVKQGAGTLTLTGLCNYTGATAVNGGVLKLQAPAVGGSIGVHFEGNGGGGSNNLAANGSGAPGASMNNWINLSATGFTSPTALTDSSSANTTAAFTINYSGGGFSTGSGIPLLNGYLYINSGSTFTLNLTGIPYGRYNVYAYAGAFESGSSGRHLQVTLGGATYFVAGDPVPTGYTQVTNTSSYTVGDYELATGLTGGNQAVQVYAVNSNGAINGFEIVNTTPANANVLPVTTALSVAAGAALDLGGASQQVASLSGYGAVISSMSGAAAVLTLSPTGGSSTLGGAIQGGGTLGTIGLVMNGSGTQVLSGSNTYTGPTAINSGKLVVNGSLISPVTINNGGTLGGTGQLTSVTVSSGGQLAPGDAPGTMILSGSLSLLSGAVMDYELDTPGSSDEISMPGGLLSLNGQQFSNFSFAWTANFGPGSYDLIEFGSSSGSLGANTSGMIGNYPASIALAGNDLVLTVVPEPSTLAMLACGALASVGIARRGQTIGSFKPVDFGVVDIAVEPRLSALSAAIEVDSLSVPGMAQGAC